MTEYEVRIISTGEIIYVTDVNVRRAMIECVDTSLVEAIVQAIAAYKVHEDVASEHANELRAWQAVGNDMKALATARDLLLFDEPKVKLDEAAEVIVQMFNTSQVGNTITIAVSSRTQAETE